MIIRAAKLLGIGAGFSAANHADRQYIPGFPPQLPWRSIGKHCAKFRRAELERFTLRLSVHW